MQLQGPRCAGGVALVCSDFHANATYPTDFMLESHKIQTHVIKFAWLSGQRQPAQLVRNFVGAHG